MNAENGNSVGSVVEFTIEVRAHDETHWSPYFPEEQKENSSISG
jgi:hypothetical protein